MPKLDKKLQKAVKEAEEVSGGFEPLPKGWYVMTLKEVEHRTARTGSAMWGVELEDVHDLEGNLQPGRQFTNLVLPGDPNKIPSDWKQSDKSAEKGTSREDAWKSRNDFLSGKIKRFFLAFGFTEDSDTDEMIGERCAVKLGVRKIGGGDREGEMGNEIQDFKPLSEIDYEDTGSADEEDNF